MRSFQGALTAAHAVGGVLLVTAIGLGAACTEAGPGWEVETRGHALTEVHGCDDLRGYLAEISVEAYLSGAYASGYGPDGRGVVSESPSAWDDESDWSADGDGDMDGDVDGDWGGDGDGDGDVEVPIDDGEPSDFSDTNVQEEGVDEADIVETDGSYLYVLHQGSLIIFDSWPADETAEIGRVHFDGQGTGLFLHGGRAVVLSSLWSDESPFDQAARVTIVDVEDPSEPSLVYQADIEGEYTDARVVDGHMYLVTNGGTANWDWLAMAYLEMLCSDTELDCWSFADADDPEAARAEIRGELVERLEGFYDGIPLASLVPRIAEGETVTPALECTDLARPVRLVVGGVVMFSWLDVQADAPTIMSTGVVGGGYNLYASRDNLYLAQTSQHWAMGGADFDSTVRTVVHKLSIPARGGPPAYVASGDVPGWTLNQFSMSEHEGYLRLATTDQAFWTGEGEGNAVWVLEQDADELREVGSVTGISPDQEIYAVRFLGDRGYVVTFRQVDPLHVIDLADPHAPAELGELEIPGYSTYLHPMADGLLLAIGRDGERNLGLSMFDVRDPARPTRLHQEIVGGEGWSDSEAEYDHHAFTYDAARQVLALPVSFYGYSSDSMFAGSILYRVDEEDGFEELGRVDHIEIARAGGCPEWARDSSGECYEEMEYEEWDYAYMVGMRRNVFIEDYVYAISTVGLSVSSLSDPGEHLATLPF